MIKYFFGGLSIAMAVVLFSQPPFDWSGSSLLYHAGNLLLLIYGVREFIPARKKSALLENENLIVLNKKEIIHKIDLAGNYKISKGIKGIEIIRPDSIINLKYSEFDETSVELLESLT